MEVKKSSALYYRLLTLSFLVPFGCALLLIIPGFQEISSSSFIIPLFSIVTGFLLLLDSIFLPCVFVINENDPYEISFKVMMCLVLSMMSVLGIFITWMILLTTDINNRSLLSYIILIFGSIITFIIFFIVLFFIYKWIKLVLWGDPAITNEIV